MIESTIHPVDVALRALTVTLEPRRADFEHVLDRLNEAMFAPPARKSRIRSRLSWTTAAALITAFIVLMFQTTSITPAGAVLVELAQQVVLIDEMTIPDDRFVHTITEASVMTYVGQDAVPDVALPHDTLLYILPRTLERWSGDQGTVRLQETNHDPQFFSAADEEAYNAAGLDVGDRLRETVDRTQQESNSILDEDWPTDPGELEVKIRAEVGDDDIAFLKKSLEFLREPLVSPELRAAVLQLVAGLELELVEESSDGGGTFSVEYELERLGQRRLTFTVNAEGFLTFEEELIIDGYPEFGVPAGTAENSATYSVPVLVDSLDQS